MYRVLLSLLMMRVAFFVMCMTCICLCDVVSRVACVVVMYCMLLRVLLHTMCCVIVSCCCCCVSCIGCEVLAVYRCCVVCRVIVCVECCYIACYTL